MPYNWTIPIHTQNLQSNFQIIMFSFIVVVPAVAVKLVAKVSNFVLLSSLSRCYCFWRFGGKIGRRRAWKNGKGMGVGPTAVHVLRYDRNSENGKGMGIGPTAVHVPRYDRNSERQKW